MKAELKKANEKGAVVKHRKEKYFTNEYAGMVYAKGELQVVATLRLYNTSAVSYACIWVKSGRHNARTMGGGRAGGIGYHRPDLAAEMAIIDAGYRLSENIGGRGDSAIERAVEAIVKSCGYTKVFIHHSHA